MAMIVRQSSNKTLWRRWPPVLWFGRPILWAVCLHLVACIWHFFQQSIEERAGQASAVPSGFPSPHQRRATNKPEPRFERKHGEVLAFGMICNRSTESAMSTTHQDQNKSGGKPRQRGRKADQRSRKSEQRESPELDRPDENQTAAIQTAAMVAPTDAPEHGAAAPADEPIVAEVEPALFGAAAAAQAPLVGEVLPPDTRTIGAAARVDYFPVGIQAIAYAYADYTRKSFEDSRSFVEKLMGVRSLDKAIELQTEFARQACANFVAESQKICDLSGELARQISAPWARFTVTLVQAGRRS
jgi:hypothetical protein